MFQSEAIVDSQTDLQAVRYVPVHEEVTNSPG